MATGIAQPPLWKTFGGTAPQNYERYFVPAIGGPLASDLVAAADLKLDQRVIDVACGTGVVARLAAARVGESGSVAALDINGGMLEEARSIPAPRGATIHWYESSAESMPLPNDAFDVAFCQLSLQFIVDKVAALREMRRVVVPSGRVLLSVPTPSRFFDVLDDVLGKHVAAATGFVRQVFSLNDVQKLEELFRHAGFESVVVRSEAKSLNVPPPQAFFWQYILCTPLMNLVPVTDTQLVAAMERDIAAAWKPWVHETGMRYDQPLLVASARV
jgi:ubiquinone/menaquinone biosynthesis C-methylase UbiE